MGPHPKDQYILTFFIHFVNQAVLNINSSRIKALQVTFQTFKRRVILKRIHSQNGNQSMGGFL